MTLHLTLTMTTTQVVETSVSLSQDCDHPNDHAKQISTIFIFQFLFNIYLFINLWYLLDINGRILGKESPSVPKSSAFLHRNIASIPSGSFESLPLPFPAAWVQNVKANEWQIKEHTCIYMYI